MGPNTNDDIPSNECLESKNSPEDSHNSLENYFQLNCCANSGTTTAIIWVNFSIFLLKVIKLDLFVSIAANHFHCYCDRGWFLVVIVIVIVIVIAMVSLLSCFGALCYAIGFNDVLC